MLDTGVSYGHVLGCGEVDQSQAVPVRALVSSDPSNHRSELLPADLSVEISGDDLDAMFWAADNADVEETALYPEPAHSVDDWAAVNHALLHLAQH